MDKLGSNSGLTVMKLDDQIVFVNNKYISKLEAALQEAQTALESYASDTYQEYNLAHEALIKIKEILDNN